MKFYDGKDGLEIIRLIVDEGLSVEEATARVNPKEIDIPVSEEVEEFCAALDDDAEKE